MRDCNTLLSSSGVGLRPMLAHACQGCKATASIIGAKYSLRDTVELKSTNAFSRFKWGFEVV